VTARAPGKLFVTGAYAVLEGHPAVVLAVDRYAHAKLVEAGAGSTRPEVLAVAKRLDADAPAVDVSSLEARGRKLGLGSSAAAAVAAAGAILVGRGEDLGEPSVRRQVLDIALRAHRDVQPRGSGGDVAAAALGGAVVVRVSRIGAPGHEHLGPVEASSVSLPNGLVWCAFALSRSIRTSDVLERLAARRVERTVDRAMAALAEAAKWGDSALVSGRSREFVHACAAHVGALASLGQALDTSLVPPEVHRARERLGLRPLDFQSGNDPTDVTDDEVVLLPSGAGGGDTVLWISTRAPSDDELVALEAAGLSRLQLALSARGVHRPDADDAERKEMARTSRIPGFFKLSVDARRRAIAEAADLNVHELEAAIGHGGLDVTTSDKTIENVIGVYALPFATTLNVRINGRDVIAPMVVEEPSVVAAASNAARIVRAGGGFTADADEPIVAAQIQLVEVDHLEAAHAAILAARAEILAKADAAVPGLVARGGGARDLRVRTLGGPEERMMVVDIYVDCRDAMGANLVNGVAEALGGRLAELAHARVGFRILSNLCDRRCVRVRCRVPFDALATDEMPGAQVARGMEEGSRFAELDPYRATTHNKGIMNGVDAVVMATGNDWRAVEAGAHAFAARDGHYTPLAIWRREEGHLVGRLELPLALGIVGGTLRIHPAARLALKMSGAKSAMDLATIAASVGLASNLAALRAMASDGIQRGHMGLHARSVAIAAGATGDLVEKVARRICELGDITVDGARRALAAELDLPASSSTVLAE
jgi:hydroxymethylglutaryl-CoA reductase